MRRIVGYHTNERPQGSTEKPPTPKEEELKLEESAEESQEEVAAGTSLDKDEQMHETTTNTSQINADQKDSQMADQTIDIVSLIQPQQERFENPEDLLNSSLAEVNQPIEEHLPLPKHQETIDPTTELIKTFKYTKMMRKKIKDPKHIPALIASYKQ